MTDPLTELGTLYKTDKVHDHHYTPHYHRRFAELRDKPVKLLEIGTGGYADPEMGGQSLEMWRDYFPLGTIVGLDINPKTLDLGERVHLEQGDQSDNRVLRHLGQTYGPFDIIIDDGSHRCDDIMASWVTLWDYLAPDGWYCVEDLQTAYWPEYGGSSTRTGETTIGWLFGLINHIHYADLNISNYLVTRYDETLAGLEIARNIAFIRKGNNTGASNLMPAHPHGIVGERTDGVSIEVNAG